MRVPAVLKSSRIRGRRSWPPATMFVVGSGERILTTEISPPHAPIDAVNDLNLTLREHIPPIFMCHANHLPMNENQHQPVWTGVYRIAVLPSIDGWPHDLRPVICICTIGNAIENLLGGRQRCDSTLLL